ncbi:MAG: alpha/beta hydrolase [Lachnospiraceae bacterium]|nr:alpha/beta hydrolase [Lachnospiraceae bacterium]
MINWRKPLWEKQEYRYPHGAGVGFSPFLTAYLHEDQEVRPIMIVVPGGAYRYPSVREAAPVARRFYDLGYQAFVLTYTCNPALKVPLGMQPLDDLARAVRLIRMGAGEIHGDPDRLVVCGFSAGGHLTGSLCVHHADAEDPDPEKNRVSARPDAAVLSYPVITSEPGVTHAVTMQALLGENPPAAFTEYMSLEKQVQADTPPAFLWSTVTDESVPMENALRYATALREKKIPFELHVFSQGKHGLSLGDEDWALRRCSETYVREQELAVLKAAEEGRIPMSEEEKDAFFKDFLYGPYAGVKDYDTPAPWIGNWPEMADSFIKRTLH